MLTFTTLVVADPEASGKQRGSIWILKFCIFIIVQVIVILVVKHIITSVRIKQ